MINHVMTADDGTRWYHCKWIDTRGIRHGDYVLKIEDIMAIQDKDEFYCFFSYNMVWDKGEGWHWPNAQIEDEVDLPRLRNPHR